MAKVPFPYTCSDVDRHGTRRWYVRAPPENRKQRIWAEPGTELFTQLYWEKRNGQKAARPKVTPAKPGTFRFIAEHYMRSATFKDLDPKLTQQPRRLILGKLIDQIGDYPAVIDPATIRQGRDRRGPGAAKDFMAALRQVYKVAIEDKLVSQDPTTGIKVKRPRTSGHHSWTLDDCLTYEAAWPLGTKQRTAYALGLYLACRRSDAVLLGQRMVRNGLIAYTQQKNRNTRPVHIVQPVVPPLREALTAWQGKGFTFLETDWDLPFSAAGFGGAFKEWCVKAGLPHCTFHGLRKATSARMAEAGYSTKQIQAVLGDSTMQQAEVYTQAADNARMAREALEGLYGEQIVPPSASSGTKSGKNT